mgnify:CR=1 FL=1
MKSNTPKEAQDPKFDFEIGEAYMALTPQRRPMPLWLNSWCFHIRRWGGLRAKYKHVK